MEIFLSMNKNKIGESIEFTFVNEYTGEEERYDYYLDSDDMVIAIREYADFYGVTLDGTDNAVWNLFVSLDQGRYEHINEVFGKILEEKVVLEALEEKLSEKAHEEFEEEKTAEYEAGIID